MGSNNMFSDAVSAPLLLSCRAMPSGSSSQNGLSQTEASPMDQSSEPLSSSVTDAQRDVAGSINAMKGFVIARHPRLGYLLLKSSKKRKGEHYQLPGGHVDFEDSLQAHTLDRERISQIAAARELYEETGIDVRQDVDRLKSLRPYNIGYKSRYFFELLLTPDDAPRRSIGKQNLQLLKRSDDAEFSVRLSKEHIGFKFVKTIDEAAGETQLHSGGHCSQALLRYKDELGRRGQTVISSKTAPAALLHRAYAEAETHSQNSLRDSKG